MKNLWGWLFAITYLSALSLVFLFGRAPDKSTYEVELMSANSARTPSSKVNSSRFILPIW